MTSARQAMHTFRVEQGLDADGGASKEFDWGSAFGLPFPIPNTRIRKPLVAYHDLHHIVGGYGTDELGEALVSAWTLGTGGGPFLGRIYDCGAVIPGLVRIPGRCLRAFVRGRRGANLYDHGIEDLLERDLAALREMTGWAAPEPEITWADRVAFVGTGALALMAWLSPVGPGTLLWTLVDDRLARLWPRAAAAG